ncbi:MAG TPA: hypothetical protein VES67_23370 [Vicinamibacterales bacterium]|nr:hypothetical protein [Vicinamibacterales bacterium]
MIRRLIIFVVVLLLTVPLAILTTILAMPFFAWVEARFGIEAVGHSGPAEWCYVSVYVTMLAAFTLGSQRFVSRFEAQSKTGSSQAPKSRA